MYEGEDEKLLKRLERDTATELQKSYQECLEKHRRLGFSKEVCKNEIINNYYNVLDSTNSLYSKIYLNEEVNKCLQNYFYRDNKLEICRENVLKRYVDSSSFTYY